ncbi:hypothetical protein AYO22_08469 [Fonsecaea multimorphosa]|nr:hypothetical protein AYO22_08469 [Fonsecaea multimorphosa]
MRFTLIIFSVLLASVSTTYPFCFAQAATIITSLLTTETTITNLYTSLLAQTVTQPPVTVTRIAQAPAGLASQAAAYPLSAPQLVTNPLLASQAATYPLSGPQPAAYPLPASQAAAYPLSGPQPAANPLPAPQPAQAGGQASGGGFGLPNPFGAVGDIVGGVADVAGDIVNGGAHLAGQVVDTAGDAVRGVGGGNYIAPVPIPGAPAVPAVPGLPGLPGVPGVPGVPGAPAVPAALGVVGGAVPPGLGPALAPVPSPMPFPGSPGTPALSAPVPGEQSLGSAVPVPTGNAFSEHSHHQRANVRSLNVIDTKAGTFDFEGRNPKFNIIFDDRFQSIRNYIGISSYLLPHGDSNAKRDA